MGGLPDGSDSDHFEGIAAVRLDPYQPGLPVPVKPGTTTGRNTGASVTTLFAFLHHVAAFALVSSLSLELMLVHQPLTLANARRLMRIDAVLGASAGLLLVVGLLRVFVFEKSPDYYFSNLAFVIKLGVFIALASLSLLPTLEFLSWRKAVRAGHLPDIDERRLRKVQAVIHGELAGIVVILLCAAVIAKGGWI
jgi:putative membrane protein